MSLTTVSLTVAASALAVLTFSTPAQQGDPKPEMKQMQELMGKAARFTQPSEHHKTLERLVGKWNTLTRFPGMGGSEPEKGTTETTWLMPGRWLQSRATGSMMGMSVELFSLIGYDNFKMSYVWTGITNMDTAMTRFEGDMTPDGKALIGYGTLDEYLTGEHDKMVKYAWRFIDADHMVLEIHDLPIGEVNTQVIEISYSRAK